MLKRRLSFVAVMLIAIALALVLVPSVSSAQQGPVSQAFTLTAAGQQTPTINLTSTMSSCSITVSNGGTFTLVPQGASDGINNPTPTWTTNYRINNGQISSTGVYSGPVADSGLTSFSALLTSVDSTAVTGVITCSGAVARSDPPTVVRGPLSFTAAGQLAALTLQGQSSCAMTLSGTGTATITPYGSSDNGATYSEVVALGSEGSNGTYGAQISPYLTNFYVAVSDVTGTVQVSDVCSAAVVAGAVASSTSGPYVPLHAEGSPSPGPGDVGNVVITGTIQAQSGYYWGGIPNVPLCSGASTTYHLIVAADSGCSGTFGNLATVNGIGVDGNAAPTQGLLGGEASIPFLFTSSADSTNGADPEAFSFTGGPNCNATQGQLFRFYDTASTLLGNFDCAGNATFIGNFTAGTVSSNAAVAGTDGNFSGVVSGSNFIQAGTNVLGGCFVCFGTLGTASAQVMQFGNDLDAAGFTSLGASDDSTLAGIHNSAFGVRTETDGFFLVSNGIQLGIVDGIACCGAAGNTVVARAWHPASDPTCTISAAGSSCNTGSLALPVNGMRCSATLLGTTAIIGSTVVAVSVNYPTSAHYELYANSLAAIAGGATITFSVICL